MRRRVAARQLTLKRFAMAPDTERSSTSVPGRHSKGLPNNSSNLVHGIKTHVANCSHQRSVASLGLVNFDAERTTQTDLVRVSRWPSSWKSVKILAASFQKVFTAISGAFSSQRENPWAAFFPSGKRNTRTPHLSRASRQASNAWAGVG